ncbi:MAG: Cna B-type domain-containing protein, partial [Vagococcus sp.]|uniref:Cna B-type domain-containing protein n=1 Tax=Vagococcus sp. TaxID=1933889 RepID=UPI002FCA11EB
MKIKKSVFMLMVMLMGTFTQLVTSVTTIQAFAEGNNQESQIITNQERSPDGGNPDNNTIAPTKESSTEESQKEVDSTENDQIEEKTEEATADQIEEPDLEKPEAQKLENPEKEVRAGGRDITTMEKSGLLPRDKQGKPTILTESNMTLNGNPITEVNPLSIGDEFQIHYTFRIPDEFGKTMADGDYFEFKLPDSDIISLTRRQEGDLIDPDNGMIYGRYIGETNGNVKMIFNDKVSENDDVDGNLMFSMKLDEKSITIPGEYEIEIPGVINDESEIIIIAGKIKSYIQKEYIGDEGLKHKWKVLINPNYLKINDFELKEKTTKGKNGPNIADSINIDKMVKAKVDLQGNITEGAQVPIANKTFDSSGNIDLGFNSIEEPYVVYLNTPVPFGTKANIYNTATLIGNVGNHYLHEEASAETNAGIDLITKEAGSYNKKDQTVDWTITYNPKGIHIDQEHAYFKDIITNGTLMEETMTVAPDLKHDVTVSNDKKEFDFVFKTDVDEPVIIKYKTKVINDKEKFVVNKVITAGQEKQVSKDISTGGEGEGGDGEDGDGVSSIVKSKPIDYQGGAQWELNINKEKQKVDKWWVTDKVDSGTIRESSFELKNLTKGGNVSKADYDLEWHDSENGKAKGFTVKYNKETSDHFKITYVTDYERNTKQTNNASYHYFVKGTEKEDEDSQTYIPKVTPEIGLAKSGRFIPEDNEIEWTVLINEKKNVAIGPNNKMTDPIMSDQEYVANSAKVYYQYGVQWEDYSFAKINFNGSKNQLEVTEFLESAYAQKVVFRTKLKNPLEIVSKTIKNTAYYQDKYTPEKNVTATLEKDIGNEIFVKKQGKENPTNPNLIDWQVDVNPHGYHLRDLEIFDESWENQIVIRESIQLKNSIGTRLLEGIDYTLDYTERYFHIKMLDDVHEKLDLTYQGRIVFPNGTIPGSTQQVKNSIRITAKGVYTTEKPIDVKIPVKVPDSSGTIQGRTRNLNVKKVSEENPNQRLSGAEFVLYRGKDKEPGKVVNRVTTDGSGNALFDKLTKGDYLLVETKAPAGFAISNEMKNGCVVTINDNETTTVEEVVSDPKENGEKLIDIPVEKKWKDVPSGITTPEVKVRLFADGDEVDSMILNKGNDYKGSFKNLPEKKNGKEITYTVREDDIPNYDSQVTGTTITNTYNNTEKTSISGEKIWKDDNNSANKRPDKVTVELLQDGNYYDKKEVYGSENWKYEFKNLPKVNNKTGKDYVYTVREKNIPGDYDSEVNGFNITNTFVKTEEDKIRINGEKKWLDNNNKVGARPDFVKVTLFQGEKEYATTEAKAINNWKYEFSNLPKKDDSGKDYVYRVEEGDIPEGYESEVDGYTITNRYTKEEVVSFSGEKKWEGDKSENRPKSVKVQLYQDDKPYKEQVTNESKNWKYEFNDLPKYDSKGYLFRYRVEEVDVPDGYYSNVDGNNIINTYSVKETTEFKGEKLWKDNNNSLKTRPDYIIVYLFQNDDYKPFDTKVVSPVGNRWEYKFTNLPKYDDNNKLYRYSVKEEEVGGYQTSNTGSNDLTNTYQNKEKTSISGKKEWEDNGNQDKTRPSSITVHLLRNDKRVDKQTVTATNDWKYTFSNLDKYDENLNAYRYTVEEEEVPGYTSEVVGTTIKNTLV